MPTQGKDMSGPSANIRVRIVVSGRVQGVYFRASARDMARQCGVCGWVRNRPDGAVEAVAEGEKAAVQAFTAWCHEGPAGAYVTSVQVVKEPYTGEFEGFQVVP
jgi:acylphosphatase